MSGIKDGGPAFPGQWEWDEQTGQWRLLSQPGMTLRDYFAARAINPVYHDLRRLLSGDDLVIRTAEECYAIADAMLRAREAA